LAVYRQARFASKLRALVCFLSIFLVFSAGTMEAVHVHSANDSTPSHECTICAVAHSGVLHQVEYRPTPVWVRAVLVTPPATISGSLGFVSSLRIRPPPLF
jgi:hypothetical protein